MKLILIVLVYLLSTNVHANNIKQSDSKLSPTSNTHNNEDSTSNFVTSRNIILPHFGSTPPKKGESRIDPITGAKIKRLTDVAELDGTNQALIVYSRYTPENTSGQYFLAFGHDSHTSWVIERKTGKVINKLMSHHLKNIGEIHEIRWDLSGNHPNRIYYRYGKGLYKIDDVSIQNPIATLIRDFSPELPGKGVFIYNDVEGDSSNDSDHWAFMAAHYDKASNKTKGIVAFVHYQISTDTVHILRPSDLAGAPDAKFQIKAGEPMAKNDISELKYFPIKPNMVEVSPLGTGIVIHTGRTWWENNTTSGTWFDGPHLWPLDFNWKKNPPIRIAQDETHSGWAFDKDGNELFVNQDNRRDFISATYISGENKGYHLNSDLSGGLGKGTIDIAKHRDFGWSNGFHFGKMPQSKRGWLFINTYSNSKSDLHETDWASDQLILMELKPIKDRPIIWRVNPNYNHYSGDYRDEAPAAINHLGNRIYVSTNWGSHDNPQEVYVIELPDTWESSSALNQ